MMKPREPKEPSKTLTVSEQKFWHCFDNGTSIHDVLDKVKTDLIKSKEEVLEMLPFIEIKSYDYDDGFSDMFIASMHHPKEIENPRYKYEMKKYKKQLAEYPLKLQKYEEYMVVARQKQKERDLRKKEKELSEAKKILKKHGIKFEEKQ